MDRNFVTIPATMPLARFLSTIEHSSESYFVVIDDKEHFLGVLSFQDIRSLLSQHSLDYLVIAEDLVKPNSDVVRVDDTLEKAFQMCGRKDLTLLPVINPADEKKIIGVVRRSVLVGYYNRRLIETLRSG